MKLFNKNNNKNLNLVPTFSDNWNFYFQLTSGDFHYSVRYDMEVQKLSESQKQKFPHRLQLNIPFLNPTENGLPDTDIEFPRLNGIEDQFACETAEIRCVARVAGGNVARYFFYFNGFNTHAEQKKLVANLVGNLKKNAYSYDIKHNDYFDDFEKKVVPNAFEWQRMLNRDLCMQLENSGETFKEPRDIDFLLIGKSDAHFDHISEKLENAKFRTVRREKMEEETYHLELVLNNIPTVENMNILTDTLVTLLNGTDVYFDGWGCPVSTT